MNKKEFEEKKKKYESLLQALEQKEKEIEDLRKSIKYLRNKFEEISLENDMKELARLEEEIKNL
ncbi:hypothetical protein GF366_00240 [Candidatus Peregrinibacteria bacterium]|nr:hypothetical protein [Candidatus Peregrinibacteria bacterium]